ncbi:MAG TPA: formylmethanofuran dehydrogenase [Ruminococcaceae bacterium]|jgi:formylmethanofuran dehydrogenase subunit E|nr:formylmethanofuran dehydrogenase [Oscillospiraceae bacterium]
MAIDERAWERCVAFHGHACGGLAIGFQAARCAAERMDFTFSDDEQLVCIAENDACGVDAIQVLLGCSVGKGNLLFHMRGKQAFSFYDRKCGKALRLVLKDRPVGMTRERSVEDFLTADPKDLFTVKEARPFPEEARIFRSYRCSCCGEMTGENWIRVVDGAYRCLDCIIPYDRFRV